MNPGAHISGNVSLGHGVMIGTGAAVIQGCTVGDWAVIGAGAVVIRDVEPGVTVVGVPARRSGGALDVRGAAADPLVVMCIVGARPNFVKVAPVLRALHASSHFRPVLVHTGQHYDASMSEVFFRDLDIGTTP